MSNSTEVSYLAREFTIQILESQSESPSIIAISDDTANIEQHNDI